MAKTYIDFIGNVAHDDVEMILKKDKEYGGSWLRRGGVGAYMMTARKIDRLEEQCKLHNYDIFSACEDNSTSENVLDTMRDLRAYLTLIESEIRARIANGKEKVIELTSQQKQDRELGEAIAKTYHEKK